MTEIPHIRVSGDARSRGLALGEELTGRIRQTVEFYEQQIFRNSILSLTEIEQHAVVVKALIETFNRDYCIEIEAIAEAAAMEPWRLYALNARTEILNTPVGECTSVLFKDTRLLGQTWDWIQELEELMVLVEHEYPNGRRLLTLTEPGMLAKIGINNRGLGLCINILMSQHALDGVPVHVLTRAILESDNVEEARDIIQSSGKGKSSHFLLADKQGKALSIEYAMDQSAEISILGDTYIHTNHCLSECVSSDIIPTSAERLAQAGEWLQKLNAYDLKTMQQILLDDSAGSKSIQSCYHPEPMLGNLQVGTCATIIMDLLQNTLHLKKGPDKHEPFTAFQL